MLLPLSHEKNLLSNQCYLEAAFSKGNVRLGFEDLLTFHSSRSNLLKLALGFSIRLIQVFSVKFLFPELTFCQIQNIL